MTTTAGEFTDSVARRLFDEQNTAHSRSLVRDLTGRVQSIVNSRQEYIINEDSFTAVPGQSLYFVETQFPTTIRITDIRQDGVPLRRIDPWRNLWKLSTTWLTDVGDPIGWANIGRSLVVIYPSPSTPTLFQAFGPSLISTPQADDDPLRLRDETLDIVKDMVVALLLYRWRDSDTTGISVSDVLEGIRRQLGEPEKELQIGTVV